MADDGSKQSQTVWPIPKFYFQVKWDSAVMSFEEVSGLDVEAEYGAAEGTHLKEYEFNGLFGRNFERGNLTALVTYDKRSALRTLDQDYTASADKRGLFTGTRFDGATSLDGRGTVTPWGSFTAASAVRVGTSLITSSAGAFHVQPTTYPGSLVSVGAGVSIDASTPK